MSYRKVSKSTPGESARDPSRHTYYIFESVWNFHGGSLSGQWTTGQLNGALMERKKKTSIAGLAALCARIKPSPNRSSVPPPPFGLPHPLQLLCCSTQTQTQTRKIAMSGWVLLTGGQAGGQAGGRVGISYSHSHSPALTFAGSCRECREYMYCTVLYCTPGGGSSRPPFWPPIPEFLNS